VLKSSTSKTQRAAFRDKRGAHRFAGFALARRTAVFALCAGKFTSPKPIYNKALNVRTGRKQRDPSRQSLKST
jgi:hypothetical protein